MARAYLYKADVDNVLWVHLYGAHQTAPATIITGSASTMYDPGTTTSDSYTVEFNIVNQDASNAVVVTVAIAQGGGTTIASPDIVYNAQSIAAKAESGWKGPFIMLGTWTVNASADVTSRGSMHMVIQKVKDGL